MSWVRFDDAMTDHPKFATLGRFAPLAGWLWVSACCYCMRYLTDGRIDLVTLRKLWPYPPDHYGYPSADELVKLLVEVHLLDPDVSRVTGALHEEMFIVHDLLEYNPKRKDVLKGRQRNTQRQKAFRARKSHAVTNAVRNAVRNGPVTVPPTPNYKDKDLDSKPEDSFDDLDLEGRKAKARELLRQVEARLGTQTPPGQPAP